MVIPSTCRGDGRGELRGLEMCWKTPACSRKAAMEPRLASALGTLPHCVVESNAWGCSAAAPLQLHRGRDCPAGDRGG